MRRFSKGRLAQIAACVALGSVAACSALLGITDFTGAGGDSGAPQTKDGSSSGGEPDAEGGSGSSSGSDGASDGSATSVITLRGYATATDSSVNGIQTLSPVLNWPQSAGDLIVVLINNAATLSLVQVSDTSGNVYDRFGSAVTNANYNETMYFCLSAKAAVPGANTVSVKQSAPGMMGYFSVNVFVFSAPGRTWIQDQYTNNSQTNVTAVTTGAVTTTQPDEVLVAGTGVAHGVTMGSGGNWIAEPNDGLGDLQEFLIVDSVQTGIAATFTQNRDGIAVSQIGTFAARP